LPLSYGWLAGWLHDFSVLTCVLASQIPILFPHPLITPLIPSHPLITPLIPSHPLITQPLIPLIALGDLTGFSPRMIVLKPGFPGYSDTLDKAAEESGLVRTTCTDPYLSYVCVVVCNESAAFTPVQYLFMLHNKMQPTPHHITSHHNKETHAI
jgi:hypothetical protein